ncbi:F-box only protein 15-like [Synchiropus splendidus]|uniref:F-box only protein 15-like n=1 Tax=Synchiropus splendidus TaxID=270530 RepID=UPI00237D688B|nr:F-box only protein 15-like [Synchiropus splendidus]XP_053718902.1 F-box only protein 15-like [Synchiropus splendidus]
MAAGRGEFFRSLMAALERIPSQPCPGRLRECGDLEKLTGQRGAVMKTRREQLKKSRGPLVKIQGSKTEGCGKIHIESLPTEALLKIVSYLDASSLFCVSMVNKLFYRLATDNLIWKKIYMAEFGFQTWTPKLGNETVEVREEPEVMPDGHWKKIYFRGITGQGLIQWRRELKDICPHLGLPVQTKRVLRTLVNWELSVSDCFGQTMTVELSQTFLLSSSMTICWNDCDFLKYHNIRNIQLYGVKKPPVMGCQVMKSKWRSLITAQDVTSHPRHILGKDRFVKLIFLAPAFIVGVWRGHDVVAFIMVALHFHRLVERSLLGSPVCAYVELPSEAYVGMSDPNFGLHGYTLHFALHNTVTEVMFAQFNQLSCRKYQIRRGLVELMAISERKPSQQRPLSGDLRLCWRTKTLEGSVKKCCWMTLTLLDEFQKPVWCVSAPSGIRMVHQNSSLVGCDENFLMDYRDREGAVKMKLIWLKQQQQFFVVSLAVYVAVFKVNRHFGTQY